MQAVKNGSWNNKCLSLSTFAHGIIFLSVFLLKIIRAVFISIISFIIERGKNETKTNWEECKRTERTHTRIRRLFRFAGIVAHSSSFFIRHTYTLRKINAKKIHYTTFSRHRKKSHMDISYVKSDQWKMKHQKCRDAVRSLSLSSSPPRSRSRTTWFIESNRDNDGSRRGNQSIRKSNQNDYATVLSSHVKM